jgi:hypothetical protein
MAHRDVSLRCKIGRYRGRADMVALVAASTLVANDPIADIKRSRSRRRLPLLTPSRGPVFANMMAILRRGADEPAGYVGR